MNAKPTNGNWKDNNYNKSNNNTPYRYILWTGKSYKAVRM